MHVGMLLHTSWSTWNFSVYLAWEKVLNLERCLGDKGYKRQATSRHIWSHALSSLMGVAFVDGTGMGIPKFRKITTTLTLSSYTTPEFGYPES